MEKNSKLENDILRRLDVISIFLLAQKGLNQSEIAKILGISNHTVQEIYGKNYSKILPQKKSSVKK